MLTLLEALLISITCSIDTLITGFAYGADKIKISLPKAIYVCLSCAVVVGLSLFLSSWIGNLISPSIALIICCTILIIMGSYRLISYFIKKTTKNKAIEKQFSLFSLKFTLKIQSTPEAADIDKNKVLSWKESTALMIALTIDSIAIGLSMGLAISFSWKLITSLLTFVIGLGFLFAGLLLGKLLSKKANLSWLSGLILIALALLKICKVF